MLKWIIIGGIALILLVARIIYVEVKGHDDEKVWYATNLDLEFSARIDSAKRSRLHFHMTKGTVSDSMEWVLNKKLKYHDMLQFLLFRKQDGLTIAFYEAPADVYQPGDSMRVNTSENSIRIFREGKLVGQNKVSNCLRENPFERY